jgi:chromate transporter
MRDDPLLALLIVISPLSLVAVGGASGIYAPLQHQSVDIHQWVTSSEFLQMFAIARMTPGPGSMITTLVGWKVGGFAGALIATLALFVPASLICFFAALVWNKYRGTEWHSLIEASLRPIAAGLVFAAVIVLMGLAQTGLVSWIVIGVASLLFVTMPKLPPPLILAGGAAVYLAAHFAGITTI